MSFVHLHRHSEYSLLDGVGNAKQYAERAAEIGQEALALTDHGSMAGVLHHIVACEEAGIKPIVGIEAYFRPNAKKHEQENKEYWHMVLLAQNAEGFRNLMRLTSASYRDENFYYKPCVDPELLEQHNEGIIVSTTCLSGYIPSWVMQGEEEHALTHLEWLKKLFRDRLFVEIQPHDFDEQRSTNIELINLANRNGIPLVATTDAHYPYKDWAETQDMLVMMNTGQTLSTRKEAAAKGEDYMAFSGATFYLMDEDEVKNAFMAHHSSLPADDVIEAMRNTKHIADMCEHYEVSKATKMPRAASSLMEAEGIVLKWCEEGLRRIGRENDEAYRERLTTEIGVLRDKRVLDYFVVIGDVVRWAKANGIRVGAGRGSAAGSLVSYLVGITAIDPIGHGLLFERFLNPTRAELPDIDIDFQHSRRKEVKEYLGRRWGVDHVADIGAYQTFGMRSALQNVSRVLDVPYERVMHVTKQMEDGTGDLKLEDIRELNEELDRFAVEYPEVWKHAIRLEGQVKAASKHAAGVVITDRPIADYMPTMRGSDASTVTQWSEKADFPIITTYGFLKIDVLGTDGLSIQDTAIRNIRERTGKLVDFEDVSEFPVVEDPYRGEEDVIRAFGEFRTLGVFQFESRGISGLLKDIGPTWLGDVIAANALFRPGPLEGGVAFQYGRRKNGEEPIEYWHEAVEPFLKETYGVMVYQEQIMQIVQALGDFSLGEADIVRKAMTKWQSTKIKTNKGRGEMQKLYEKFEEGCIAKGLPKKTAEDIWAKILQFSIYGFNKSHSAGYALQAYQDMWLKLRYPLEFYASLLTHEVSKVPRIIREAKNYGIAILPPDINASGVHFGIDGNAIRFGLEAIKHVGEAAVEEIVSKRPFTSLEDMESKVVLRKCNARVRQALVESGAFDSLGGRSEMTEREKVNHELRLLGYALSGDSIGKHKQVIVDRCVTQADFEKMPHDRHAMVGGEITQVREVTTRKGDQMAFVDIAFGNDTFSATFFPDSFAQYSYLLTEGNAILAYGQKDIDRNCLKVDNAVGLLELVRQLEEAA